MSVINYSKWDHIEISDDEGETHPNVDTPSLFKWRHESRILRKEEEAEQKKRKDAESKLRAMKIDALTAQKARLEKENGEEAKKAVAMMEKEIAETLKSEQEFRKKEAELEAYAKAHPKWDVDNISKDKTSRTLINKIENPDSEMEMTEFFKKYEKELQEFGLLTSPKASQQYLVEHMSLVCDHLASYLVVWCVDLAVEDNQKDLTAVSHQCICAQFIMELAKSLKTDPRSCVNAFYARMNSGDAQHKAAFEDELRSFRARVAARAKVKLEEAEAKVREEEANEREARLGPGGLDPFEVMDTLPEKIQEAFKTQNTPLLQEGFAELSQEDFRYHFDRAVKSGLWVPQGGEGPSEAEQGQGESESEEEKATGGAAKMSTV